MGYFNFAFFQFIYPPSIQAHPKDEIDGANVYDQKQILTVGTNIILKIELTIYAIEKIRIWESIDRNRDRAISESEKADWMTKGADPSYLTDSTKNRISFIPVNLNFPDYFTFFDRPPAQISIEFKTASELLNGRDYQYHYQGKDKKLSGINFEIIGAQDIQRVGDSQVSFITAANSSGKSELGIETSDRLNSFLSSYVKQDKISAGVFVWALVHFSHQLILLTLTICYYLIRL